MINVGDFVFHTEHGEGVVTKNLDSVSVKVSFFFRSAYVEDPGGTNLIRGILKDNLVLANDIMIPGIEVRSKERGVGKLIGRIVPGKPLYWVKYKDSYKNDDCVLGGTFLTGVIPNNEDLKVGDVILCRDFGKGTITDITEDFYTFRPRNLGGLVNIPKSNWPYICLIERCNNMAEIFSDIT